MIEIQFQFQNGNYGELCVCVWLVKSATKAQHE